MNLVERKRIVTALIVLFALVLIFLLLAQSTVMQQRDKREQRYITLARQAALNFHVPPSMVLAVMRTESDFRPDAISSAGACGLMQLMPETFLYLQQEKFEEMLDGNAILDPAVNIRYGTYYLSYLYEKFGDWQTALAAYNAGEGHVSDWLRDPALSKNGKLQEIPFPETAAYVKKTLDAYAHYQAKYQVTP